MDFDLPPEDDPRRLMLRAGLDANIVAEMVLGLPRDPGPA